MFYNIFINFETMFNAVNFESIPEQNSSILNNLTNNWKSCIYLDSILEVPQ